MISSVLLCVGMLTILYYGYGSDNLSPVYYFFGVWLCYCYILVSVTREKWAAVHKTGGDADTIQWTDEFQDTALIQAHLKWRGKITGYKKIIGLFTWAKKNGMAHIKTGMAWNNFLGVNNTWPISVLSTPFQEDPIGAYGPLSEQ